MTPEDKEFIIRTISEASGMFQILEIQSQPLTEAQQMTITGMVERLEMVLDKICEKKGETVEYPGGAY